MGKTLHLLFVVSTVDAPAEFYTLLVNGQRPKPASTASFVYHDINCHPCPYGGRCRNGISAVPNFWGYVSGAGDRVRFQGCPRGYCCASAEACRGIDMCRADLPTTCALKRMYIQVDDSVYFTCF